MPDLKDIPDAVRWRFAAGCAATLPALYDVAFREALGEKYDALEQEIWMGLPVWFRMSSMTARFPPGTRRRSHGASRSRPSSSSAGVRG